MPSHAMMRNASVTSELQSSATSADASVRILAISGGSGSDRLYEITPGWDDTSCFSGGRCFWDLYDVSPNARDTAKAP